MGTSAFGHISWIISPRCVILPARTTVVTDNTPPILPGIIYAQISYYFQTKIATRRFDNLMVIVLALLSTGKTMHSVSIVSIAYKEALIYPDLPNDFVSGSNTINFVIQPILVSDH